MRPAWYTLEGVWAARPTEGRCWRLSGDMGASASASCPCRTMPSVKQFFGGVELEWSQAPEEQLGQIRMMKQGLYST